MVTKNRVLDLSHVKVLVLDEADNMLQTGTMSDQSISVKKCDFLPFLSHCSPTNFLYSLIMKAARDVQIVLFSATFTDVVRGYATRFAPGANEIKLKKEELSLDAIKQFFMGMPPDFSPGTL